MISPKNVKRFAGKKEEENYAFRTFLKANADPEDFDEKVNRLHRELFAAYDCSKCRNCCKEFHGSIPAEDIEQDAKYLKMTRLFQEHAPSGAMSAEDWFRLQQTVSGKRAVSRE